MDSDEIAYDELLSKSTVRENLPVSVSGNFPSEEDAQKLLCTVLVFTRILGSQFDLSALDGITISQ